MGKLLGSKSIDTFLGRVTKAIGDKETARKVSSSVAAALASVQRGVIDPESKVSINAIRITIGDFHSKTGQATVFSKDGPVDAGPKKPTPVRAGGSVCFTWPKYDKDGKPTGEYYKVCLDYEYS